MSCTTVTWVLLATQATAATALQNGLGLRPGMGWNWDYCVGCEHPPGLAKGFNETFVWHIARYLNSSGLQAKGSVEKIRTTFHMQHNSLCLPACLLARIGLHLRRCAQSHVACFLSTKSLLAWRVCALCGSCAMMDVCGVEHFFTTLSKQ
jgi:hypothetical protein